MERDPEGRDGGRFCHLRPPTLRHVARLVLAGFVVALFLGQRVQCMCSTSTAVEWLGEGGVHSRRPPSPERIQALPDCRAGSGVARPVGCYWTSGVVYIDGDRLVFADQTGATRSVEIAARPPWACLVRRITAAGGSVLLNCGSEVTGAEMGVLAVDPLSGAWNRLADAVDARGSPGVAGMVVRTAGGTLEHRGADGVHQIPSSGAVVSFDYAPEHELLAAWAPDNHGVAEGNCVWVDDLRTGSRRRLDEGGAVHIDRGTGVVWVVRTGTFTREQVGTAWSRHGMWLGWRVRFGRRVEEIRTPSLGVGPDSSL